jgi:hypothetical protein
VVILGDIVKYGQHLQISGKLLEPVNNMDKASLYQDEQKVLKWFVHDMAEQKINYYDKKIAEMKQKYDMDFSTFQNKIYLKAVEVDLEEWNDFVLWGSYIKAYRYWSQFC